jgi:hypothetical protein
MQLDGFKRMSIAVSGRSCDVFIRDGKLGYQGCFPLFLLKIRIMRHDILNLEGKSS